MITKRLFRRPPIAVEIPPNVLSELRAGILVCTSPRSGSNHFAALMASAGLGNPQEWFGGRRLLELPGYPRDAPDQLLRALTDGRSSTGIYAIKIFASQFSQVAKSVNLPASLPNLHYVRLTRSDLLGQAISWTRARQTRRFRSTELRGAPPRYDGQAIARSLERLLMENLAWDRWFARNGLPFLQLTYEQVQQNPVGSLSAVAQLVGASISGTDFESGLEIQRDRLNEEWRERLLSEDADPSSFEHRKYRIRSLLRKWNR